jgi:hypothetical protein
VLASVVQFERTGDSAGIIDEELDWLADNCSAELDVFADHVSANVTAEQSDAESCAFTSHIEQESIALLRGRPLH